jgi:hypothetical protein
MQAIETAIRRSRGDGSRKGRDSSSIINSIPPLHNAKVVATQTGKGTLIDTHPH